MTILVSIILAAVGIVLGFFIGQQIQKKKQAEDNAKQNRAADEIIQRAKREADEILKDAKIEAKDIIFKAKQEAEKEMKERRKDLQQPLLYLVFSKLHPLLNPPQYTQSPFSNQI